MSESSSPFSDLEFREPLPLPESPHGALPLPAPAPAFRPDASGDNPGWLKTYFDPERWDAELYEFRGSDDGDPVDQDRGRCDGHGQAVLFASDFHMGDGTAGGDDFLESHLLPDRTLGGLYTGFSPPGASRAGLFVSVLTYALERVKQAASPAPRLDVVLHGDVLNSLELTGRGGTRVSEKHEPFFRALAVVGAQADVFWLRGNHDYVVPRGPWRPGEFYVNEGLRTLAEHGDFWDKENWPPGPDNKGSRFVVEGCAAFEVHAGVYEDHTIKYLMSGIDNIRPLSNRAVRAFLDRRSKYSGEAGLAALLARLKFIGAADDSAAYKGAQKRRQGRYEGWLMVQGHTHVPAMIPGVYYNTGTWITTLMAPKGEEVHMEAFPFLLVYQGREGQRVEEFYLVGGSAAGSQPQAHLQTAETINTLRKTVGYKPLR